MPFISQNTSENLNENSQYVSFTDFYPENCLHTQRSRALMIFRFESKKISVAVS